MSRRGYFTEIRKREKDLLLRFIKTHKGKSLKRIVGLYSQETGMKISTLDTYIEEMRQAGLIKG